MIKKLVVENWKSHLRSELEFSLGTNALVGIVGSGKTSLLDAICFALFGTFPTLQTKKIKLDDVIMKKPIEQKKASVELIFEKDGNEFFVKRVIERGKGTTYSEIRKNGEIIEAPSSSQVTEVIEKILKINYELFSKAIYSEQNALDYFLTIPRGKRMKSIDELLMIDKFESARANTTTLINRLLDRKEGIQSTIEQADVEKLKENMEKIRKEIEEIKIEKKNLFNSLEKTREEKRSLEKELEELRKLFEELENETRKEKELEAAINEHLKNLSKLEKTVKELNKEEIEKSIKELQRKKSELEKNLEERQKVYEKKKKEAIEKKMKIEFLKTEKIEKLEKELEELLKMKEEYDNTIKVFGEDIDKVLKEERKLLEKFVADSEILRAKIEGLSGILSQISSVEGKCPVCESRLTPAKKKALIAQKKQEMEALKKDLENAEKRKEMSEKKVKELEEASEKLSILREEIKKLKAKERELENSKKEFLELSEITIKLDNEIAELSNKINEILSEVKIAEKQEQELAMSLYKFEDYANTKKRIEELVKEREEKIKAVLEIEKKIKGRDLKEKEELLRIAVAKEKEIEGKIYHLEQMEKEKTSRLKDYEKDFENLLKNIREVKRIEEILKKLKIFETALKETQVELRREFVTAVNYSMSKLWNTLYPYKDFDDIRIAIEEGDYVLQLREKSGRWVNVEGVASGGERSIAALALRIAFALVLAPQLRWLVLDEPTHNLDAKAVEDLATTLREKIGEFIDQVFLITHDEKLEEAVTGSLYRLEREKEKDGATKVIRLQ
jgi:exonuclease SbcC